MAHDVFISYSSDDKAAIDATCHILESAGLRCWVAPRDVPPGAVWSAAIMQAIESCGVMVVLVSQGANASEQVLREVERAVSKGIPILPFCIEKVALSKSLEYLLSARHWMDAITPPLEEHLEKLAGAIRSLLAAGPAEAGSGPRPASGRTARPRRRRSRIGLWAGLLAGVIALAWLGTERPWRTEAVPEGPRSVADPGLRAVLAVIQRLDALALEAEAQFGDRTLAGEFEPPEAISGPAGRAGWVINVAASKAKAARILDADAAKLLLPIDGLAPSQRTRLLARTSLAPFEQGTRLVREQTRSLRQEAEALEKELGNLRSLNDLGATEADGTQAAATGAARLACLKESLVATILIAYLGWNDQIRSDLALEEDIRTRVQEELEGLRALAPRGLDSAVGSQELEAEQRDRIERARERYAGLVGEVDEILKELSEVSEDIASRYDGFLVVESDDPDRVIEKAVVARSMGLSAQALHLFEEYGRRFSDRHPDAPRYAEVAALFTRVAPEAGLRSGLYVAEIPADSPAHGLLEVGDVVISAGGEPTPNTGALADSLRAHAGERLPLVVLRQLAGEAGLSPVELAIDVPLAAPLGVTVVWI